MSSQLTYHRPKALRHIVTADQAGSGVVLFDVYNGATNAEDSSAAYSVFVRSSARADKTSEIYTNYVSGVLTIEDNGAFALAEGDIVNCIIMPT